MSVCGSRRGGLSVHTAWCVWSASSAALLARSGSTELMSRTWPSPCTHEPYLYPRSHRGHHQTPARPRDDDAPPWAAHTCDAEAGRRTLEANPHADRSPRSVGRLPFAGGRRSWTAPTTCNQYSLNIHSIFTQYAIHTQSICNPYADVAGHLLRPTIRAVGGAAQQRDGTEVGLSSVKLQVMSAGDRAGGWLAGASRGRLVGRGWLSRSTPPASESRPPYFADGRAARTSRGAPSGRRDSRAAAPVRHR